MEIGLQFIDDPELITGQDKKVDPSFERIDNPVFAVIGGVFNHANRRSADTNDFPAGFFGCRDLIGDFGSNDNILTVDMMLGRIIYCNGPKSIQPHMKRRKDSLYTLFPDLLKEFRSVMQTGSRCCNTAVIVRIHCLVSFFILQWRMDIRRKRHVSDIIDHLFI